jgi:DNA-binding MarR family transcriptional regulator
MGDSSTEPNVATPSVRPELRPGPPATGPAHVAFVLTQVGALAAMGFAERLAPLGLTPAHAGLLRAVAADPGRSQQAVATELGVLPSRLVALVDELEQDGLLERRRNPGDRRYHALHLTAEGEARLIEIGKAAQRNADAYLAPLDEKEQDVLGQLLDRLATAHGLASGVHPGFRALGRDT